MGGHHQLTPGEAGRRISVTKILTWPKGVLVPSRSSYLIDEPKDRDYLFYRIENVSVLIAECAVVLGLTPFGVPQDLDPLLNVTLNEGFAIYGEQDAFSEACRMYLSNIFDLWNEKSLPTYGSLTNVTLFGPKATFLTFWSLLSSLKTFESEKILGLFVVEEDYFPPTLPSKQDFPFELVIGSIPTEAACADLLKKISDGFGVFSKYPEIYYIFPFQLRTWLLKVSPRNPSIEEKPKEVPISFDPEKVPPPLLVTDPLRPISTSVPVDFFTSYGEDEVQEIIRRLSRAGEQPTSMKITSGSRYASLQDLENHKLANASYNDDFSVSEIRMVVKYFEKLLKGKTFKEAKVIAQNNGMKLWVRLIYGFTPNKPMNIKLDHLSVDIEDEDPKNAGMPSDYGIISAVNGIVGFTPK